MKTLQDRYLTALTSRGAKWVKTTSKYIVLTHTVHSGRFYYLGKSGALRVGNTITGSVPVSKKFKDELLAFTTGAA